MWDNDVVRYVRAPHGKSRASRVFLACYTLVARACIAHDTRQSLPTHCLFTVSCHLVYEHLFTLLQREDCGFL